MAQRLTVFEAACSREAQAILGRKFKGADLSEWSTDEATIDRNIAVNEVKVHGPNQGVWGAILKPKKERVAANGDAA